MTALEAHAQQPLPGLTEQDLRLLGRRIAQRRRSRGWKQKHLALQASIEPGRLSRLERGKAMPKLQEVVNLRWVLGGTLDELVFEAEPLSLDRLTQFLREVEQLATEEQVQMLAKLLHVLVLGFRCAADQEKGSAC
jgi:transcriptional regulator with XRE-family HTH domain